MLCPNLMLWLLPVLTLSQSRPTTTTQAVSPEAALEIIQSIPAPDQANPPEGISSSVYVVHNRMSSARASLYCSKCEGVGLVGKRMRKVMDRGTRYVDQLIPGTEKPCPQCQATGIPVDKAARMLNELAQALMWCPPYDLSDNLYYTSLKVFDLNRPGQVCKPILEAVNKANEPLLSASERGRGIVFYGRGFGRLDAGESTILGCELPGSGKRFATFVERGCPEVVGSVVRVVGVCWGTTPSEAGQLGDLPLIYAFAIDQVRPLQFDAKKMKWLPGP